MDYEIGNWVTYTAGRMGGPGDGVTRRVQVTRRLDINAGPAFVGHTEKGAAHWGLDAEITKVESDPPIPPTPRVVIHSLELVVNRPDVELTWQVVPHGDRYAIELSVKIAEEV